MLIIRYIFYLEFPRCKAIFAYEARQSDELSFPTDAILEILEREGNSDWFKARYGNQIGLIPSTYVIPIDEFNPCKLQVHDHNYSQFEPLVTFK